PFAAYDAPSLFRAEESVARAVAARIGPRPDVDAGRVRKWLGAHARRAALELSDEQRAAIEGIAAERFAVLTGGPGCGKTTALRTLVALLDAMGRVWMRS
ncbi:MAG: AAA family ATPase, partial [Kofleriaceae bacterium]